MNKLKLDKKHLFLCLLFLVIEMFVVSINPFIVYAKSVLFHILFLKHWSTPSWQWRNNPFLLKMLPVHLKKQLLFCSQVILLKGLDGSLLDTRRMGIYDNVSICPCICPSLIAEKEKNHHAWKISGQQKDRLCQRVKLIHS